MLGHIFKSICYVGPCRVLPLLVLLGVAGCGDFFEKKSTELETRKLLTELEKPRQVRSIKNPLPQEYRGPAKRVYAENGVKMFYFTRNIASEKLADMVRQQFATMKHDGKGGTFYEPKYPLTFNPAANQLIVHCPNDQEVDKVLAFLKAADVPPIQINIDCLVVERFADVTLDWETTILIENLFGEKITLGAGKFEDPAFPGAALRESARRTFGLDFGYWRNQDKVGHRFRAVVDLLISRGYLKILMNPQLETINGQKAKIVSKEFAPIEKILVKEGFDEPFSLTDYQWVEDALEVTPHVYADGSIGLQTNIKIGSKSKPEGVVQASIITERAIDVSENRIKPGESLVIGGLRKSEKRSVIRGIPFFKDLPIVGVLFSSKDFEEKATEIIFILTPSISSGGIEYAEMVERVRRMHQIPKPKTGVQETLIDPFGSGAYIEQAERQAAKAELEKLKADIKKTEALGQVDEAKQKLVEATEQVAAEKARADQAKTEADKAKTEAEKARQQAAAAQAEAQKARQAAEKAEAAAQEAKKQAVQARIEAEKARQQQQQPAPVTDANSQTQ